MTYSQGLSELGELFRNVFGAFDFEASGRHAAGIDTVYRSLDPNHATPDVVEQFRRMAEFEAGGAAHA